MTKFSCALVAVTDLEASKKFYAEVMRQEILLDLGWNVVYKYGFAIQYNFDQICMVDKASMSYGGNNCELYFEEADFDGLVKHLAQFQLEYVHPVVTHPWHQRCISIYDPDHHIIEIGESMSAIAKRYAAEGNTPEQIAEIIQHPLPVVESFLKCDEDAFGPII